MVLYCYGEQTIKTGALTNIALMNIGLNTIALTNIANKKIKVHFHVGTQKVHIFFIPYGFVCFYWKYLTK